MLAKAALARTDLMISRARGLLGSRKLPVKLPQRSIFSGIPGISWLAGGSALRPPKFWKA